MANARENQRPNVIIPITVQAVVETTYREGEGQAHNNNANSNTATAGHTVPHSQPEETVFKAVQPQSDISVDQDDDAVSISGEIEKDKRDPAMLNITEKIRRFENPFKNTMQRRATILERQRLDTATNRPSPAAKPASCDTTPIKAPRTAPRPTPRTVSAEAQTTPKVFDNLDQDDSAFCPYPDKTESRTTEEKTRFFAEGFTEHKKSDSGIRSNLPGKTKSSDGGREKTVSLSRSVSRESQTSLTFIDDKQQEFGDVGKSIADIMIEFSQAAMLNDRARYLLAKSPPDYEGVVNLLDGSIITSSGDIVGKTILAESLLKLLKTKRAHKVIRALKEVLTKLQMTGNDVMGYAKNLVENSAHTRAIILIPIACDIFRANASSFDDVMSRMHECNEHMFDSVKMLIKHGDSNVALQYGIESMEKMCAKLSSVDNADPDKMILENAWVLDKIGFVYNVAEKYEKSLKQRQEALKILDDQFHGYQSTYQVHGRLLHNIGASYENLKDFDQAKKYYSEAVIATRLAKDFSSDDEKNKKIEASQESFNYLCSGNARKGKKRSLKKLMW